MTLTRLTDYGVLYPFQSLLWPYPSPCQFSSLPLGGVYRDGLVITTGPVSHFRCNRLGPFRRVKSFFDYVDGLTFIHTRWKLIGVHQIGVPEEEGDRVGVRPDVGSVTRPTPRRPDLRHRHGLLCQGWYDLSFKRKYVVWCFKRK